MFCVLEPGRKEGRQGKARQSKKQSKPSKARQAKQSFPLPVATPNSSSHVTQAITLYPVAFDQSDSLTRSPFVSNSSDEIFSIYTSGTTGNPKSIHHATIQFSVYALLTSKYYFFYDSCFDSICCKNICKRSRI